MYCHDGEKFKILEFATHKINPEDMYEEILKDFSQANKALSLLEAIFENMEYTIEHAETIEDLEPINDAWKIYYFGTQLTYFLINFYNDLDIFIIQKLTVEDDPKLCEKWGEKWRVEKDV